MNDGEASRVNSRISRIIGWHFIRTEDGDDHWTLPDGGMDDAPPFQEREGDDRHFGDFYTLPDFCRNNGDLGYVMDWLDKQTTRYGFVEWRSGKMKEGLYPYMVTISSDSGYHYYEAVGEGLGEALCYAIIKYWDNEKPRI